MVLGVLSNVPQLVSLAHKYEKKCHDTTHQDLKLVQLKNTKRNTTFILKRFSHA